MAGPTSPSPGSPGGLSATSIARSILNADPKTVGGLLKGGAAIGGGLLANRDAKARAKTIRKVGKSEAKDQSRSARRLAAEQQVAFGAGGVDPNRGTPASVTAATTAEGELNALRRQFLFDQVAANEEQGGLYALAEGVISGTSLAASTPGVTRKARSAGRSIKSALVKKFPWLK